MAAVGQSKRSALVLCAAGKVLGVKLGFCLNRLMLMSESYFFVMGSLVLALVSYRNFIRQKVEYLPLFFFLLSVCVCTAYSSNFPASVGNYNYLVMASLLYSFVYALRSEDSVFYMLDRMCQAVAVLAITSVLSLVYTSIELQNRLASFSWLIDLANVYNLVPNTVLYLLIFVPVAVGRMTGDFTLMRVFTAASLYLSCWVISLSLQSRLGVIFLSGYFLYYFFSISKNKFLYVLVVCVSSAVLFLVVYNLPIFQKFHHFSFARLTLWVVAWEMFLHSPGFGLGPNTFGHYYSIFIYKAGINVQELADNRVAYWPHNLYFELLCERGVTGFLGFVLLIASTIKKLLFYIKASSSTVSVYIFQSLVLFLLASVVEISLHPWWAYIMLFLLVAVIDVLYRQQRNLCVDQKKANKRLEIQGS